jgi:hypothetical protein
MNYKISSDGSTAVSLTEQWLPMSSVPHGKKVRLLTIGRVSVSGSVDTRTESHYLAWAPEPKEPDWLKQSR